MRRILVVDDMVEQFAEAYDLLFPNDRLTLVADGAAGLARLSAGEAFDVVLLDVKMPARFAACEEEEGLAVLERMTDDWPELPVILLSVLSDVDTVVRGMRRGAFYYVQKPPDPKKLRHLVDLAAQKGRDAAERRGLRAAIDERDRLARGPTTPTARAGLGDLVGGSPAMRRVYDILERAARGAATVLVLGESGTGKELAARELHRLGPRARGPFVALNATAIPEALLEAELFGAVKGAYTGATSDRKGAFESARGGTLFLDEIGDMDLALQAKLLRALDQGEVRPVGSDRTVSVDVRVVAATHRDLRMRVARGEFREDLFYRLNVIPVTMPPLREHVEDLPALVQVLVAAERAAGGRAHRFSTEALALLATQRWPGNVRQLANVVRRSLALGDGDVLGADDVLLDPEEALVEPAMRPSEETFAAALEGTPFDGTIVEYRNLRGREELRELIVMALRSTGDIQAAGRLVGFVGRGDAAKETANLRKWMERLDIRKRDM